MSVSSDVAGAMCESVTIVDQVQQSYTGRDVTVSCLGSNTTDYTLIALDCGNGEYHTGFGGEMTSVCHYEADLEEMLDYTVQCSVGNDTMNPDCATGVSINAPDQAMCESLDPVDESILFLDEDEE